MVTSKHLNFGIAMKHALLLNLFIVGACLAGAALTGNALCMLGLLAIVEMPFGLLQPQYHPRADDLEDAEGRPIGFTADIG